MSNANGRNFEPGESFPRLDPIRFIQAVSPTLRLQQICSTYSNVWYRRLLIKVREQFTVPKKKQMEGSFIK
jgi:hypothetical protein